MNRVIGVAGRQATKFNAAMKSYNCQKSTNFTKWEFFFKGFSSLTCKIEEN